MTSANRFVSTCRTVWRGIALLGPIAFVLLPGCGTPYYEACDESGRCPSSYVCADRGILDVCTTLCTTTAECRDRHGDRSFCNRTGVCLSSCTVSDDCPPATYCDVAATTCLR